MYDSSDEEKDTGRTRRKPTKTQLRILDALVKAL
jgi:hypothetical protein